MNNPKSQSTASGSQNEELNDLHDNVIQPEELHSETEYPRYTLEEPPPPDKQKHEFIEKPMDHHHPHHKHPKPTKSITEIKIPEQQYNQIHEECCSDNKYVKMSDGNGRNFYLTSNLPKLSSPIAPWLSFGVVVIGQIIAIAMFSAVINEKVKQIQVNEQDVKDLIPRMAVIENHIDLLDSMGSDIKSIRTTLDTRTGTIETIPLLKKDLQELVSLSNYQEDTLDKLRLQIVSLQKEQETLQGAVNNDRFRSTDWTREKQKLIVRDTEVTDQLYILQSEIQQLRNDLNAAKKGKKGFFR